MKVTIIEPKENEEEELILKCFSLNDELIQLLRYIKSDVPDKIVGYKDGSITLLETKQILYFEYVDQRVFAYTKDSVYESKSKLYQLEQELSSKDFFRANKAVIINLHHIERIIPSLGGRFEVILKNGYKVIISRMYVKILKEKLGL